MDYIRKKDRTILCFEGDETMNVELAVIILLWLYIIAGGLRILVGTFRVEKPEITTNFGPIDILGGLLYIAIALAVWFL